MNSQRIIGLDILRVVAVTLVVYIHIVMELPDIENKLNIIAFLPRGSDIFFVLSGFLVGTILIKGISINGKIGFLFLKKFLFRRWLRTIPTYYLVLIAQLVLLHFGLVKGVLNKYFITYPVFFQNLHKHYDFLMWESWSLSVHEWFYLLYPAVLMLLFFFRSRFFISLKGTILLSIIILMIFSLVYRLFLDNHADWDMYYRKLVLSRFDSIGIGVLSAYIYFFHERYFLKSPITKLFIAFVVYQFIWYFSSKNDFFNQIFSFPLVAICIALTLPFFLKVRHIGVFNSPIFWLSKYSYIIYLIHVPLLQSVIIVNLRNNLGLNIYFLVSLYLILTVVISYCLHHMFEKHFIAFGKRLD